MAEYVWSFEEDTTHWEGGFDTAEQALECARAEAADMAEDGEVVTHVHIGERAEYTPSFSADDVIEQLQDWAYGEAGEAAESYLYVVNPQAKAELDAYLADWISKYAQPNFYLVRNLKEFSLESGQPELEPAEAQ